MREIVQIQIGQCGNNIGTKFWEVISEEHGIDKTGKFVGDSPKTQLEEVDVYFGRSEVDKFQPRAVLVDTDPASLGAIPNGPWKEFFQQDDIVTGKGGMGNNWAKGWYSSDAATVVSSTMDIVRKHFEGCEHLQGFQIIHSLGGGTGSAVAARILNKLNEAYSDRVISTYSVAPSPKVSDAAAETYNAILAYSNLLGLGQLQTFCFDNNALHDICFKSQGLANPNNDDLNHLVTAFMSGQTAPFRYRARINETIFKLMDNMTPFPRLRFFLPGYAPLTKRGSPPKTNLTLPDVTQHLFDAGNMLAACNPLSGRHLTAAVHFQGSMSHSEAYEQMQQVRKKHSNNFADWIPGNLLTGFCKVPPKGLNMSGTYIVNSTAIKELFQRLINQFNAMLGRKAFLQTYTSEGMAESEFHNASNNVNNLIKEYKKCQDYTKAN